MKNICLLIMVLILVGCSVRTYTIEKERVDTGVDGNQGYLFGTPKPEEKQTHLKKTRTVSVVEVEFGASQAVKPREEAKEPTQNTQSIEGNQGYLVGDVRQEPVVEEVYVEEDVSIEVIEPQTKEKEYRDYTIQKNDTLQKISAKFYGTTKKWYSLYEENKDILKSPDKIYPGTKIRIPIQ